MKYNRRTGIFKDSKSARKVKLVCCDIGIATALIGLGLMISSIVVGSKVDKMTKNFVEDYKAAHVLEVEDVQEAKDFMNMSQKDIIEFAKEHGNAVTQIKLDNIEEKDNTSKALRLGGFGCMSGMLSMMGATVIAKNKQQELLEYEERANEIMLENILKQRKNTLEQLQEVHTNEEDDTSKKSEEKKEKIPKYIDLLDDPNLTPADKFRIKYCEIHEDIDDMEE